METITSRQNPLMTHLKKLGAKRAYREKCGEYLCDGGKLLDEALRFGAEVRTVVAAAGAQTPALPADVRAVCVSDALLRAVSPVETPQGVLFTVSLPQITPPDTLSGKHYLVLDNVQDPGNVGTILRTADAFDCDGVLLLPGCADVYAPKTVRATMGAVFRQRLWRCGEEELEKLLRTSSLPLYGAALRDDTKDVRAVDFSRCAVAVGSEGHGLSGRVLALCTQTVRIPMSPRCESLNAAVAAALLLWEMYR